MKTTLVVTAYFWQGKLEEFSRAYLANAEANAIDQARLYWADKGCLSDYNREIHFSESEITYKILSEHYPDREDLILAVGRIYALDAIENGAPAIPEGTTYGEWSREIDVETDALSEWIGNYTKVELALFFESYKKNLFSESPTC